jgi:hypothetical protein
MAAVEILGNKMHKVFKELGINYKKTYDKRCNPKKSYDPHYEVYEISQNDMKKLEEVVELPDWSWWRYAKGSNMGTPFDFFQVNGRELVAWENQYKRMDLRDDWENEPDSEKEAYHYSFKEYVSTLCPNKYNTLTEYMCEELGASNGTNVCALAVDLARANGMTMGQLFRTYEG